jgi:hypothetical protein
MSTKHSLRSISVTLEIANLASHPLRMLCARCHKPFTAQRRDSRYCGGACRQAAYRERKLGRTLRPLDEARQIGPVTWQHAYHESGHAVAALALASMGACPPESATLDRYKPGRRWKGPRVLFDPAEPLGPVVAETAMTIAGPYAEFRFRRRRVRRFADLIRIQEQGTLGSDWVAMLSAVAPAPGEVLEEAFALARTTVEANWRAVVAVARALVEHDTLDRRQLRYIYAKATASVRRQDQPGFP